MNAVLLYLWFISLFCILVVGNKTQDHDEEDTCFNEWWVSPHKSQCYAKGKGLGLITSFYNHKTYCIFRIGKNNSKHTLKKEKVRKNLIKFCKWILDTGYDEHSNAYRRFSKEYYTEGKKEYMRIKYLKRIEISDPYEKFVRDFYDEIDFFRVPPPKETLIPVMTEDGEHNFFHANYIDMTGRRVISSQAPHKKDVKQFWQMIYEQKVEAIVMVRMIFRYTYHYYPTQKNEKRTYGAYGVTNLGVELKNVEANWRSEYDSDILVIAITTLQLEFKGKSRIVKIFYVPDWVDNGPPLNPLGPIVVAEMTSTIPKILVHCEAGIGRTGTHVIIDIALQKIYAAEPILMIALIKQLRESRAESVYTVDQYMYILYALLKWSEINQIIEELDEEYQLKWQEFEDQYLCEIAKKAYVRHLHDLGGRKNSPPRVREYADWVMKYCNTYDD